jgi:hypothetical protein
MVSTPYLCCNIHLSGGIEKLVSTDLMSLIQPHPMLRYKVWTFMLAVLQQPSQRKYVSLHPKLLPSELPLPTTTELGTESVYDLLYVSSTMPITFSDYLHLLPRPAKQRSRYPTGQSGQTIKPTNLRGDLTPNCKRTGFIGTMKHLLCGCMLYLTDLEPAW